MTTLSGLTRALRLIEEMRKLDAELPASHAAAFVIIAKEEGSTQREVGQRTDASTSAIQRVFDKMSERGINGRPGLGLIEVRPGADQRERRAFLTPKGRRVAESMQTIVEG